MIVYAAVDATLWRQRRQLDSGTYVEANYDGFGSAASSIAFSIRHRTVQDFELDVAHGHAVSASDTASTDPASRLEHHSEFLTSPLIDCKLVQEPARLDQFGFTRLLWRTRRLARCGFIGDRDKRITARQACKQEFHWNDGGRHRLRPWSSIRRALCRRRRRRQSIANVQTSSEPERSPPVRGAIKFAQRGAARHSPDWLWSSKFGWGWSIPTGAECF